MFDQRWSSIESPNSSRRPGIFVSARRGSVRGSGARYSGRDGHERTRPTKKADIPSPEPPLGELILMLNMYDFEEAAVKYTSQSTITQCKTVASYNWLDKKDPEIIVPGKPPKWTPLSRPQRLRVDEGDYFCDPNAARFPRHPMEPAIVAALATQPNVARQVDVVACGSTLGNLLRFVRGEDKPFRMLVEAVGDTVFLIRRENSPQELIPDIKGYGHTFPDAYTTWSREVAGSVSHQRVISYRFGGLGFLVRFQGDGYIVNEGDEEYGPAKTSSVDTKTAEDTFGDLAARMAASNVAPNTPTTENEDLKVAYAGELVQQDRIFELKTRSINKKKASSFEDTFGDQLPRLWVSQVPNFILAYHNHGVFDDISVRRVETEVKDWEKDHADVLSKLAAVVNHLASLVRSQEDHKLELRHWTAGNLEVRKQLAGAGDTLSDAVRARWLVDSAVEGDDPSASGGRRSSSDDSD